MKNTSWIDSDPMYRAAVQLAAVLPLIVCFLFWMRFK